MDPDTEFDIAEHAETLAAKAIKGYTHALYRDSEYLGDTYDSDELIYNIIDSDAYPSEEIFEAVFTAAVAYIDDHYGGPWMTEEEYAAFTGADEPPESDQPGLPF